MHSARYSAPLYTGVTTLTKGYDDFSKCALTLGLCRDKNVFVDSRSLAKSVKNVHIQGLLSHHIALHTEVHGEQDYACNHKSRKGAPVGNANHVDWKGYATCKQTGG